MFEIMTVSPNAEPTLADVIRKLDDLATDVDGLKSDVGGLKSELNEIRREFKTFDNKFNDYQKATQWVVQLAFSLIASATIIVIVSNVVK